MITALFLRQIPATLEAGIRSGQLDVYGSTIRNVANGRIAGFLQETSGLSRIAELVGSGPAAPLKLIGTGIRIVQNEQIKSGIAAVQQGIAMLNRRRHNLGNYCTGRARRLLEARRTAIAEATPLLDASAMASGLRVGALALSRETAAAISVARDDARRLERLTGGIGAADLARAWIAEPAWQTLPGSSAAGDALALMTVQARAAATTLRAREAVAVTRAEPLIALEAKGKHAREWLGAAREEQEVPLLLMEG